MPLSLSAKWYLNVCTWRETRSQLSNNGAFIAQADSEQVFLWSGRWYGPGFFLLFLNQFIFLNNTDTNTIYYSTWSLSFNKIFASVPGLTKAIDDTYVSESRRYSRQWHMMSLNYKELQMSYYSRPKMEDNDKYSIFRRKKT